MTDNHGFMECTLPRARTAGRPIGQLERGGGCRRSHGRSYMLTESVRHQCTVVSMNGVLLAVHNGFDDEISTNPFKATPDADFIAHATVAISAACYIGFGGHGRL